MTAQIRTSTRDFIRLFGTPESQNQLRKALSSASGSGQTLIAENLETAITNTMIRLVPELALPVYKYDPMNKHQFSRITSIPSAGSGIGENGTTPVKSSALERDSVDLKILRRRGRVTGFLKSAAKKNYDAVDVEVENTFQSFGNDIATYFLYGNAGADQYTFSGLDFFISTNRTNMARGGEVPADFQILDDIIDANARRKGTNHRRVLELSPELNSKFGRMYTSVRDNREIPGTQAVEIAGGWRLKQYRDVPIIETSQTRPQGQMTSVVAAHSGSGALANIARYFQVAPVTWDGEQIASAEVTDTSSSSASVTLTFTNYTNALYYKIYASATTGTEKLVKQVSAYTYDGNGTPTFGTTVTVTFTTEPLTADATSVPTHMQNDLPLNYTGGVAPEDLFLWDLDIIQGLGKIPYTNENGTRIDGIATIEMLARTDDWDDFLIKSYIAMADAWEATSAMVRGLRVK